MFDVEDAMNKINTMNGWLKLWLSGRKIPPELNNDCIIEIDEYLKKHNDWWQQRIPDPPDNINQCYKSSDDV